MIRYFLFLLLTTSVVFSQSVKGVVVDDEGNPLEMAYVYNIKTGSHAHSNIAGEFLIEKTQVNDSLRVGLLGYKSKTIKVISGLNSIKLAKHIFNLNEVTIEQKINALETISAINLKTDPVKSSQEILQKVPGLFIGQHAGGGKAEQIFLRGFDIDHGTDINLSVDGMPVNMVSHAHGQGYSDLHFIIPETINKIDFDKGSYNASKGNFTTAGYVSFSTKDILENSSLGLSIGQFNSKRIVGLFNLIDSNREDAYVATEYLLTDGPFTSPQNFNRLNVFGKYSKTLQDNSRVSFTASHFTSKWDASGQIPIRAVKSGMISRFGAIDDTEGGNTKRTNLNIQFNKYINDKTVLKTNTYFSKYDFELYSNFTFFLEDEDNGDQIKQYESRNIFGLNTELHKLFSNKFKLTSGFGFRSDIVNDVELSHTLNRKEVLQKISFGDVNETNFFGYANAEFNLGKFTINPALRVEYFEFNYNDDLTEAYKTQEEDKIAFLPKFNVIYQANQNLQVYLKSGIGFHSNDTRVIVEKSKDILPLAYSLDVGLLLKPTRNIMFNAALWQLNLEQEFVYVGDAGIVEPSGETIRKGIDLGLRYQAYNWLFINTDFTYAHARSKNDPKGSNYIPLAPDFTFTGGLNINLQEQGISGGVKVKFLDDRPANEDNSIIADGYFVTNLNVNYTFNNITVGMVIENLFDVEWNETQFATISRLKNEVAPVEEIHFTPGTPFFLKGSITYSF
jgi:hypothetical protein